MKVLSNVANWARSSGCQLLMVILAIVIAVFLAFKIKALMHKDAEAHKR